MDHDGSTISAPKFIKNLIAAGTNIHHEKIKPRKNNKAEPKTAGKIRLFSFLVNNAGYGIKTSFHETSLDDEEDFIRVLGTSVIMMTKLFLPKMIEKGNGKIMIVSSVASFAAPSAIQPLYGPIKTFMNRFSDSININYKHKGVTSTAVCPGFTTTGFHTASGVQEQMDRVPKFLVFTAERVADEAIEATLSGQRLCVPTKTYKFLVFMLRNMPQWILYLFGKILAPGRYNQ